MNVTIYPGSQPGGVNFEEASVVRNIAGATVSYSDTGDPFVAEGTLTVGSSVTLLGSYFFRATETTLLSHVPVLTGSTEDRLEEAALRLGLLEAAAPLPDGDLDLEGVGTRIDGLLRQYQTANGINMPARGDGFLGAAGDAANGSGASFFLADTVALNHRTKGSAHIYTAAGVLTDDVAEFGEMGLWVGSIQIDRTGSYVSALENTVIATVPARAAGSQVVMQPSFTLAELQAALDDSPDPPSQWAQTGTRSYSSIAAPADPLDIPGTAFAVLGNHEYGLLAAYTNLNKKLIASVADPAKTHDLFYVNGFGELHWRDPLVDAAEPLTTIKRMFADTPGTPGSFRVDGTVSVGVGVAFDEGSLADIAAGYIGTTTNFHVGGILKSVGIAVLSDSFQIADAADITTSATGGAATALPAQPVGYFKMYDDVGNARKVAYYAT